MKEFIATIKLAYKDIEVITRLLRSGKFHPVIDPPPQPSDVNIIVEVPLRIKSQGKDNTGIAAEIIIGNKKTPRAEIVTGFSELPSSPWSELGKFLTDRGWETIALLGSGIGAVYAAFYLIAYLNPNAHLSLEWYNHIEIFLLGAAPALIDLCYAGAARRKNALTEEQKQIASTEHKSNNSTNNDTNSKYAIQR